MRSSGAIGLLILLVVLGLGGCMGVSTYNGLVSQDEGVNQAWSNVETQYQRRADLIPNLVNTVRGAADFEQETLTAVVNARSRATGITLSSEDLVDPAKVQQFQEAQTQLGGALSRLLLVAENYPQLRATDAFRDLQAQLEGTENRINTARTRYNEAVRGYNTAVRRFPASLVAGMTGFSTRAAFEANAGAENAPTVDFSNQ